MTTPDRTAMPEGAVGAVQLSVRTIGRHARQLADDGGEAVVIARFERSAYVQGGADRLACVGGDGLGLGPLNALVAGPAFARAGLAVGDRVVLDTAAATMWQPHPFPAPTGEELPRARAVLEAALAHTTPRGLADPLSRDPASVRAQRGLAALRAWLCGDPGGLPDDAAALIGLGPGLTPAGDDALGGAMIALTAFGRPEAAARLARAVLPLARERTSDISYAHLAAAADGYGAAALHDTLAAVAACDRAAAVDGLRRLDRIGHSSGWDALAGSLAALRALG